MSGGTRLHRPTALGSADKLKMSPTYDRIVRFLAGYFGVEPIRSLVNYYQTGDDYTSFHSDQYFSGVNMTIGASFGEERKLLFEHIESKEQFSFPQYNGDVFAFTDSVNRHFMHAVPRERRARSCGATKHTPGRISVIVWARREQDIWKTHAKTLSLNLLPLPHVLEHAPNTGVTKEVEEADAANSKDAHLTTFTDILASVVSEANALSESASQQQQAMLLPQQRLKSGYPCYSSLATSTSNAHSHISNTGGGSNNVAEMDILEPVSKEGPRSRWSRGRLNSKCSDR
eukprot:TRINITY_DN11123_c0_g1_i6.p1 TRINITY_DN11123_c0_g1~~TRINITY_DN11123_c0_g1_i6.p1  ORF type:complete len:287 (-),score=40.16 TRINITY_DN11123_c0_g1_i6:226-1086(-)